MKLLYTFSVTKLPGLAYLWALNVCSPWRSRV